MTTMRDLANFHDPNLYLPIRGVVFKVTAPNAADGLRLKRHMLSGAENPDPREETELTALLLGATYDPDTDTMAGGLWDEMVAAGVTYQEIMHVADTAKAHYGVSEQMGDFWWESRLGKAGDPLGLEDMIQWLTDRTETTQAEQETQPEEKPAPKPKPRPRKKPTS